MKGTFWIGGILLIVIACTLGLITFQNYETRQKAMMDAYVARIRTLDEALAAAGQSSDAPAIREQITTLAAKGAGDLPFTQKEVTALYAIISRAVGSRITAKEKLAATECAMYAEAAGMGQSDAANMGINFANIARERKPGTDLENLKDADIRNMAYGVSVGIGGAMSELDLRALARAHPQNKKQALDLLIAAHLEHEDVAGVIHAIDESKK